MTTCSGKPGQFPPAGPDFVGSIAAGSSANTRYRKQTPLPTDADPAPEFARWSPEPTLAFRLLRLKNGVYDRPRMMFRRAQFLRGCFAILLILGLMLVLVHWHQDRAGQDCGLCYAHQLAGLQVSAEHGLTAPNVSQWRSSVRERISESDAFAPAHPGRAPPVAF